MSLRLAYTSKDFSTILSDIQSKIQADIGNQTIWNTFMASDVGRVLIDTFAAIGDMIAFYLDHQAAETYLNTATLRESAYRILSIIGYQPKSPTPASVDVQFNLSTALSTNLIIPQYTVLQSSSGIQFVTSSVAILPAGQVAITIPCRQGYFSSVSFVGTGQPSQQFNLGFNVTDAADGFYTVTVGGTQWTQATYNSFVNYGATDQVYTITNNPNGTVTITFGDGTEGAIPGTGIPIVVQYLSTLGSQGNGVPIGFINQLVSVITDQNGNPVSLTVSNIDVSAGGADAESITSAQTNYPGVFKALRRAVTKADFLSLVNSFPGVFQGVALDAVDSSLIPNQEVDVYIYPTQSAVVTTTTASVTQNSNVVGGFAGLSPNAYVNYTLTIGTESHTITANTATTVTLDQPMAQSTGTYTAYIYYNFNAISTPLLTFLQSASTDLLTIKVLAAVPLNIDVIGYIEVLRAYGLSDGGAQVLNNVNTAVTNFFNPVNGYVAIGQNLSYSQLISVIQAVAGVYSVTLTSPTGDVILQASGTTPAGAFLPTLSSLNITVQGLV